MAITTFCFIFPRVTMRRYRWHSRTCAFHEISMTVRGQPLLAFLERIAHRGPVAIAPRRFAQQPAEMRVAGLGDAPPLVLAGTAGRELARHRAAVAHQLARMREARELPDLGDHADGRHLAHAAQSLQRLHHRANLLRRRLHRLIDRGIQPLDALLAVQHLVQVLASTTLERRPLQPQSGQPRPMPRRPRLHPRPAGADRGGAETSAVDAARASHRSSRPGGRAPDRAAPRAPRSGTQTAVRSPLRR